MCASAYISVWLSCVESTVVSENCRSVCGQARNASRPNEDGAMWWRSQEGAVEWQDLPDKRPTIRPFEGAETSAHPTLGLEPGM